MCSAFVPVAARFPRALAAAAALTNAWVGHLKARSRQPSAFSQKNSLADGRQLKADGFHWVGSGPSEPLLGYIWHRLAVQAEIGQNRSIFPKWTNQPESIVLNGLTGPAGSVARGAQYSSRGCAGRRLPPCTTAKAASPGAKSEVGLCGRLPPACRLTAFCHRRCQLPKVSAATFWLDQ